MSRVSRLKFNTDNRGANIRELLQFASELNIFSNNFSVWISLCELFHCANILGIDTLFCRYSTFNSQLRTKPFKNSLTIKSFSIFNLTNFYLCSSRFIVASGSVRIPLQMSKCNHGPNSTYLSMNSFNNNNLAVPGANDETNITTSDNLLLQSTTTAANQHWTRNLNGNSQRSLNAS